MGRTVDVDGRQCVGGVTRGPCVLGQVAFAVLVSLGGRAIAADLPGLYKLIGVSNVLFRNRAMIELRNVGLCASPDIVPIWCSPGCSRHKSLRETKENATEEQARQAMSSLSLDRLEAVHMEETGLVRPRNRDWMQRVI